MKLLTASALYFATAVFAVNLGLCPFNPACNPDWRVKTVGNELDATSTALDNGPPEQK
ncbi:hypothetical protein Hypma_012097 [Hypsizygus marmoreus]|uniref:Uncharacterized protein n=1 Tax=Hypsizygus marmoreus TaxID=39966 RepID=A0A369JEZ3_HYPMA|nr:hypothetical protein Hypma_012097 [Hypsizygus marmoreus]